MSFDSRGRFDKGSATRFATKIGFRQYQIIAMYVFGETYGGMTVTCTVKGSFSKIGFGILLLCKQDFANKNKYTVFICYLAIFVTYLMNNYKSGLRI
jgi:hypothetical protein